MVSNLSIFLINFYHCWLDWLTDLAFIG